MSDFFTKLDEVWDAYIGELERLIGGQNTDKSVFQPYSVSHAFAVDHIHFPNYSKYLANRECDTVTSWGATNRGPVVNGPIYTGTTLTERYEAFLREVSAKVTLPTETPEIRQRRKDLENEKSENDRELKRFDSDVDAYWNTYKVDHPIPPGQEEWVARKRWEDYHDYSNDRHIKKEQLDRSSLNVILFEYGLLPPEAAALKEALLNWTRDNYMESFPPSSIYENEPGGDYSHWGSFKRQTLTLNYDDFFNNDGSRTITIDENSHQSNSRASYWNASGGYSNGFVSIRGSAGSHQDESQMRDSTLKVVISWKRLEEVPIARAPWFKSSLFYTYGTMLPKYWGPGGLLPCFPTSMIVARGLTIEFHLSQAAKDTFNRVVSGGGGWSIGPISVGGDGGSEDHAESHSEQTYGYSITDSPKTARILGIRVERPNYSSVSLEAYDETVQKEFESYRKAVLV